MLHDHLAEFVEWALKKRNEDRVSAIGDAIDREARHAMLSTLPQRERVDSPYTGAVFAARQMGIVLAQTGGFKAMAEAIAAVEDKANSRGAEWLARQWDGIECPDGAIWTA